MEEQKKEHDCNDLGGEVCEECCTHEDRDGAQCMDCEKDLTEMLTAQAEDYYERNMEVYGQHEDD